MNDETTLILITIRRYHGLTREGLLAMWEESLLDKSIETLIKSGYITQTTFNGKVIYNLTWQGQSLAA